jgi:hypothetical protein
MRAVSNRTVYTSISVTPEARDSTRALAVWMTGVLGDRISMSDAINILARLRSPDLAELIRKLPR